MSKAVRICLALALLTLLPAAGQAATREQRVQPRNDIAGLPNFVQVSAGLYRGAQPDQQGFRALKKMGVRTIINLRAKFDDVPLLGGLGFRYIRIPINSWSLSDEDVVTFLQVVTDCSNQPVFVHCQHGADRTGIMVAIYRMYAQEWSKKEAVEELNDFGFHLVWINLRNYLDRVDLRHLKYEVDHAMPARVRVIK